MASCCALRVAAVRDTSELEPGRERRLSPRPPFPERALPRSLEGARPEASPRPKLLDMLIGLFPRKMGGVSASICAVPWGCRLLRTVSPFVTVPWDPGKQAPLAFRAWRSRDFPWAVATKTGSPRVKSRTPDACRNSLPGDNGALSAVGERKMAWLGGGGGGAQIWHRREKQRQEKPVPTSFSKTESRKMVPAAGKNF